MDEGQKIRIQDLNEIENSLMQFQDTDVLLENILYCARLIANADAGSIYEVENDHLVIKHAQNETLQKKLPEGVKLPFEASSFPITKNSIAGYTALSGECIVLDDVSSLSPERPFVFNNSSDLKNGYHTKSMISVPLVSPGNRIIGVVQIINAMDNSGNVMSFTEESVELVKHFALRASSALERSFLVRNMIERMQSMAMFHDPVETYPHVKRVSLYSLEIYDQWCTGRDLDEREVNRFRDDLKIASCCHDFGKIGIEDCILKKKWPRLDSSERKIMMSHTIIGALLFKDPVSSLDIMIRDVCLHHHEWYDGSEEGYPGNYDVSSYITGEPVIVKDRLSGSQIPLAARIVAIADVFDALSHRRIYKEAWSIDASFKEIKKLSGKQFDPELTEAFLNVRDRISAIHAAYPNALD